jgi:hypothetical protein
MTHFGHDQHFEKYSFSRILELGILKISFRGVIVYAIQAIDIITGFRFSVFGRNGS